MLLVIVRIALHDWCILLHLCCLIRTQEVHKFICQILTLGAKQACCKWSALCVMYNRSDFYRHILGFIATPEEIALAAGTTLCLEAESKQAFYYFFLNFLTGSTILVATALLGTIPRSDNTLIKALHLYFKCNASF